MMTHQLPRSLLTRQEIYAATKLLRQGYSILTVAQRYGIDADELRACLDTDTQHEGN